MKLQLFRMSLKFRNSQTSTATKSKAAVLSAVAGMLDPLHCDSVAKMINVQINLQAERS
jgi:hypothetical protein